MTLQELKKATEDSVGLLEKVVNSVSLRVEGRPDRIVYDNYQKLLGDGLVGFIKALRTRVLSSKEGLDLAFSRTLIEVGIVKTTVFFSHNLTVAARESILLECISHDIVFGGIDEAKRLFHEEESWIGDKTKVSISSAFAQENGVGKNGVYHRLNDLANKKLKAIFNQRRGDVYNNSVLQTIDLSALEVIFSNVLHGNMIALMAQLSESQIIKKQHMALTILLRVSLYASEIISDYTGSVEDQKEVKRQIKKINWANLAPEL